MENTHVLIPRENYEELILEKKEEILTGTLTGEERRLQLCQLKREFERQLTNKRIDLEAAQRKESEVNRFFANEEGTQVKMDVLKAMKKTSWEVFGYEIYIQIVNEELAKLDGVDPDPVSETPADPSQPAEPVDESTPEA